jgi:exopolyphosphatase / guanosine-5'-triphosphate,3'-diphosphate pyrophosphatase
MIKAVIDLGTNSVKCSIARVGDGTISYLDSYSRVTRLGENLVGKGGIGKDAMERNLLALREIDALCERYNVDEVICVGAQTLRVASDSLVFRELVQHELGWDVRVLSGSEEAELTFKASASLAPQDMEIMVIDSGGGSTEFSFGTSDNLYSSQSLPLGAVVLTSEFVKSDPLTPNELTCLREHIYHKLSNAFPEAPSTPAIGSGGTLTALVAVCLGLESYTEDRIHGYRLGYTEVMHQTLMYAEMDIEGRKEMLGLDAARADIITAGAVLIGAILEHFGLDEMIVSTHGLRHAILERSRI